ncbi:MAG: aspartate kinase [Holosporales bacterium]|jgi:aspartate kinase|nr:aspartate kinase [Holosporales bacterium]
MSTYVLKFGGSSVATVARIENVTSIIQNLHEKGHRLIVVVSAMQGVTNQLLALARNFTDTNYNRESDVIISTGEQVSSGLLALCLQKRGISAKSLQGWQIPIVTESLFGESSIKSVSTDLLLGGNIIPVISGFQGISENNEITTIGRGGSDASAVAVANAVMADECFIYTDVDGIYTADPRIVLNAQKLQCISYEEMAELSFYGAKVLQHKSVNLAHDHNVKLRVLSSFSSDGVGTIVDNLDPKEITGIAHNISSILIETEKISEFIKIFEQRNINFIKLSHKQVIVDKSHKADIQDIMQRSGADVKFDENIGVITVVGQRNNIQLSKNIHVKYRRVSERSSSIVVPFQQTEIAIVEIHRKLFQ